MPSPPLSRRRPAADRRTLTRGASQRNQNYLIGELDELEVSNSRAASTAARAATSQAGRAMVVLVNDAQKEAARTGLSTTTLRNVTVDGWIVIGLCSCCS